MRKIIIFLVGMLLLAGCTNNTIPPTVSPSPSPPSSPPVVYPNYDYGAICNKFKTTDTVIVKFREVIFWGYSDVNQQVEKFRVECGFIRKTDLEWWDRASYNERKEFCIVRADKVFCTRNDFINNDGIFAYFFIIEDKVFDANFEYLGNAKLKDERR